MRGSSLKSMVTKDTNSPASGTVCVSTPHHPAAPAPQPRPALMPQRSRAIGFKARNLQLGAFSSNAGSVEGASTGASAEAASTGASETAGSAGNVRGAGGTARPKATSCRSTIALAPSPSIPPRARKNPPPTTTTVATVPMANPAPRLSRLSSSSCDYFL